MSTKPRQTAAQKDAADKLARKKRADAILQELRGLDPDVAKLLDAQGKPMRDPEKDPATWSEHVRFVLDPEVKVLFDEWIQHSVVKEKYDGAKWDLSIDEGMPFLFLQMTRNLNRLINLSK